MDRHDEAAGSSDTPASFVRTVPALLTTAVVGLAGLFIQVAKLEQLVNTVVSDIQELKSDSKERLNDLEDRVRQIEVQVIRTK